MASTSHGGKIIGDSASGALSVRPRASTPQEAAGPDTAEPLHQAWPFYRHLPPVPASDLLILTPFIRKFQIHMLEMDFQSGQSSRPCGNKAQAS